MNFPLLQEEVIKELLKKYNNGYVRTLIQLIPFSRNSTNNILIKEPLVRIGKERLETFFDILDLEDSELTEEKSNNEDFLHNYFSTLTVVLNARAREKIKCIGLLLKNSIDIDMIFDSDRYGLFLSILNDLSSQEMQILEILYEFESQINMLNETRRRRLEVNEEFWENFEDKLMKKFLIEPESLDEFFMRIEKTGCIYMPRQSSNDYKPYSVATTNTYHMLKNLITPNIP